MATRQTGMTAETAAPLTPTRAVIAQEVSRALSELADDSVNDDENEIEMTSADRVSEMLQSDLGDRAYVRVYKMDERSGQYEFCKDYSPQEFETNGNELIRTEWGYGKFRVVLYGNVPGTKRFTIRAKNDLSFAKPLIPTAVAVAPPNNGIDRLAELIAEGQARQERLIEALINRPTADPVAQLTQTLGLMTTMREAMGLNAAPAPKSSVKELIEELGALKEAQELLGGGKEKDDPTSQLLALGGEVIGMVKTGMQGAQQPAAQPFPQLAVPASFNTAPAETHQPNPIPETDDADMLEKLLLLANLRKFSLMAGDDAKIEDAADFLDAKLTDELLELLHQDAWFELLQAAAQSVPELTPILTPILTTHRDWLTKVRTALLQEPTP